MRPEELLLCAAYRDLSDEEIARRIHRECVGGNWEKIGFDQFEYLKREGLNPAHRLVDIGCGALRLGVHLIPFLDPGNYFGVDANPSLIRAGRDFELPAAGISERQAHLRVDDEFDLAAFGVTFHFAWAYSVFTHLPINCIERCLVNVTSVLAPGGRFYATYRSAPALHHVEPIVVYPGEMTTYSDRDPYHYNFAWFEFLARELPLEVEELGAVRFPRGARMLRFTKS